MAVRHEQVPLSRRKESMLLAILVAIQFTNLMDFVILMPLGVASWENMTEVLRLFNITTP